MSNAKKVARSGWMEWSFAAEMSDTNVTPAKQPKTEPKRRSSVSKSEHTSMLFAIPDKRTKLNSLPALLNACEPQQTSELTISRQKQAEICDWLDYKTIKGKPCALILSGPSGCGKTVGIKLLAKGKGFDCTEWITPSDQGADENNRFIRQGDKFEEFVVRTTRYRSIFDNYSRRLLLVKDFPNVYLKDSNAFNTLLQQYFSTGKEPIVFICTDCEGNRMLQTLFPPNIREQFGIDHISVNAVTQAATKNILKRVSTVFNTRASHMVNVSQQVIDEILSNNIGDIRSNIINLIFSSLKVPNSKKECEGRSRDESLSLFHAIGRVTNPKRIVEGKTSKFVHDPDEIAYFFQTQPSTFLRFLQENHLNTTRAIEGASTAADILSISDCFINEWRDDNLGRLGLSFCIHGIMITNKDPVSGWNPVKKPPNNQQVDIIRDLATAETSWYESLIKPQANASKARSHFKN